MGSGGQQGAGGTATGGQESDPAGPEDTTISWGTDLQPPEVVEGARMLAASLVNPGASDYRATGDQHRTYHFEAAGADVVINGHDHLYERVASQSADGRPTDRGIRQFTAGTGGAELYRFVTTAPNSEVRIAQYGILRLALQPGGYRWEFVLTAGGLADSGNDICH